MPDTFPAISPESAVRVESANAVDTSEGRVFTGLPYGCPKLDWRVKIETAVTFTVTYGHGRKVLGKTVWSAETFSHLREAMDFHEEIASGVRAGVAGVVIALREDGSVIGEVPTRRQEAAIIARSRQNDMDFYAERFMAPMPRRP